MNRILREFDLTTCSKEFSCEKCKKLVMVGCVYFKHDSINYYTKLCFKCFKREVKEAIDILQTKVETIERL